MNRFDLKILSTRKYIRNLPDLFECLLQTFLIIYLGFVLGGGQSINNQLKVSIDSYLKAHSRPASNRLVQDKSKTGLNNNLRELLPVRYLNDNQSKLFKLFPYKSELAKNTFINYLRKSGQFKKPFRVTDLCDYCHWATKAKKSINDSIVSEGFTFENDFIPRDFSNFIKHKIDELKEEADSAHKQNKLDYYTKLTKTLNEYESVLAHKKIADTQREAYNQQRQDKQLLADSLLIEVDFKQKIPIGLSPAQASSEYYHQELRSCLGNFFAISY